jgi:hypothetical protein
MDCWISTPSSLCGDSPRPGSDCNEKGEVWVKEDGKWLCILHDTDECLTTDIDTSDMSDVGWTEDMAAVSYNKTY